MIAVGPIPVVRSLSLTSIKCPVGSTPIISHPWQDPAASSQILWNCASCPPPPVSILRFCWICPNLHGLTVAWVFFYLGIKAVTLGQALCAGGPGIQEPRGWWVGKSGEASFPDYSWFSLLLLMGRNGGFFLPKFQIFLPFPLPNFMTFLPFPHKFYNFSSKMLSFKHFFLL